MDGYGALDTATPAELPRSENSPEPISCKTIFTLEWILIRRYVFEWLFLGVFVLKYLCANVFTSLAYHYGHQLADYIPKDWCALIFTDGTTCIDHADELNNGGKLYDIFQDTLPDLGGSSSVNLFTESLPDIITIVIFAILIVPLFYGNRARPIYFGRMVTRFFRIACFMMIIRPLFYLSTTLPPSDRACIGDVVRPSWYDIFFSAPSQTCGDMVFSGHTSLTVTVICTFLYYGGDLYSKIAYQAIAITCIPVLLVLISLILMLRNHYTVDIVCALFLTPMVFRLYSHEIGEDALPVTNLPEYRSAVNKGNIAKVRELEAMKETELAEYLNYSGEYLGMVSFFVIIFAGVVGLLVEFWQMAQHYF